MFKLLIFFFCLSLLFIYPQSSVMADWPVDTTAPTCAISFSPASPTVAGTPITITLTGSDSSGISSLNLIKDGTSLSTSTYSPLTYTWNPSAGSYTFTASATDTAGNINSSCITDASTASYSVTSPGPISSVSCSEIDAGGNVGFSTTGTNITLTATPVGGTSSSNTYSWTFDDSPTYPPTYSSAANPITVSYTTAGTKTASVVASSTYGGTATCQYSVQIYPPLSTTCSASPTPPPAITTDTQVTWTAANTSGGAGAGSYEYSWTGDDLSVARNPSASTTITYSTTSTTGKTAAVTVYSGGLTSQPFNCSNSVVVGAAPPRPYIKTSGGDVHSNTNINTPGGP